MATTHRREPLVIVGSGGHARVVHELIEDLTADGAPWDVVGFLDDDAARHGVEVHGLPVLGGLEWLTGRGRLAVALGVGNPVVKRAVVERLSAHPVDFPALIHPRAVVSRRAEIEEGVVITAGAALASHGRMRAHSLALVATIGHDADIGRYASVLTGARLAGHVEVREGALVGSGAVVIQGRTIGGWSTVGAGAVVLRDVDADVTVLGNPARVARRRMDGWHRAGWRRDGDGATADDEVD